MNCEQIAELRNKQSEDCIIKCDEGPERQSPTNLTSIHFNLGKSEQPEHNYTMHPTMQVIKSK